MALFDFYLVAGILAHASALFSFFAADDFGFLYTVSQQGIATVWTVPSDRFFRPWIWLSFWFDYRIWGLNPIGYHLTNLILHAANAWWITLIAQEFLRLFRLMETNRWLPSLAAGLLFLVHPSHTEAVSWISGRSDVIATFWILPSLFFYLVHQRTHKNNLLAVSIGLYGLSLLSKESVVTFTFLILILDFLGCLYLPGPKSSWIQRWGYFGILAVYLVLRRIVLGDWIGGYGSNIHTRLDFSMLERNFLFFTARALLPSMEYPIHAWIQGIGRVALPGIIGALILAAVTLWKARRNERCTIWIERARLPILLLVLFLMYAAVLAPVLNLSIHLGGSLGERLIYFPGVFILLMLVLIVHALVRRPGYAVLICGVLTLFYAAALHQSNRSWVSAGQLTQQIIHDLGRLGPARRVIILNLPDTIGGAYVFRNGVKSAYNLFAGPARVEEIRVAAFQSLASLEDGVEVRRLAPGTYEVKTTHPRTYFLNRRIPAQDLAFFQLPERARNRVTVRINEVPVKDRIVYYSLGSLHALP
ncbi:MAG: hypothetical protein ACE15F_17685 [bacterium]